MPPRRLQNRSEIAPKWLPEVSRSPPESGTANGNPFWLLFLASWAALGVLLGRSWRLLGPSWRLLGRSWALLGRSWGSCWPPGGLLLELSGPLFEAPLENSENLKKPCFFQWFFMVFGLPGGSKIEPQWLRNRSGPRPGTSWRSLGASRRCLGVSWRPLGALGASWAPLGALLQRF